MAKTYTLLLNTGYAEGAAVYFTPFQSVHKHKDAKAALLHLANWLRQSYEAHNSTEGFSCCVVASDNPNNQFCPKCGRSLADREFDPDAFREWICKVCACTMDDIGANDLRWDDPEWEIGGSPDLSSARLVFEAEEVISAAIGHSSRKEKTFESICEERTRTKTKHFSFW